MSSYRPPKAVVAPVAVLMALLSASAPAASVPLAAPVATEDKTATVESGDAILSAAGRQILPVQSGVLIVSTADGGQSAVTLMNPVSLEAMGQTIVSGPVAAQGSRMAAIDVGGVQAVEAGLTANEQAPVLRLFRLEPPEESSNETSPDQTITDNTAFVDVAVTALPEEQRSGIRRFGSRVAMGGNAIAVVSETTQRSDRIDIFTVTPSGSVNWAQTLSAGTLETNIAVSASGAIIASSGVNRLAGSGDLLIHRIGQNGWVPTQRFLRIGGGPVVIDDDRLFVQRNSFFTRGAGPWVVLSSAPGSPYAVDEELPVEGESLTSRGTSVAVGDAERGLTYLLERSPVSSSYRFSQAIASPGGSPGGDEPLFGAAVSFVGPELPSTAPLLFVGAPGPATGTPGGQVHRFMITDGPIGCTIVGTAGDDDLVAGADLSGDTICGLDGDDTLVSTLPTDRLQGGSGRDTCTGPAVIIENCE